MTRRRKMGKKNDVYRKRYQKKKRKSEEHDYSIDRQITREWEEKLKALPWKPNQRYPSTGERYTSLGGDKQAIYEALQQAKENYGFGRYPLNIKRLGTWGDLGKKLRKAAASVTQPRSYFNDKKSKSNR